MTRGQYMELCVPNVLKESMISHGQLKLNYCEQPLAPCNYENTFHELFFSPFLLS